MTGLKTAAAFGAVLTIGGWLASGVVARRTPQGPAAAPVVGGGEAAGHLAGEIRVGLKRLSARRAESAYSAPSRNPFRFREPESGSPETAPEADVAGAEHADEPAPPALRLAGIAEDETPDGIVRRAVISTASDLSIVGEGDRLGRFRVVRISATGVELEDEAARARLVLHLK